MRARSGERGLVLATPPSPFSLLLFLLPRGGASRLARPPSAGWPLCSLACFCCGSELPPAPPSFPGEPLQRSSNAASVVGPVASVVLVSSLRQEGASVDVGGRHGDPVPTHRRRRRRWRRRVESADGPFGVLRCLLACWQAGARRTTPLKGAVREGLAWVIDLVSFGAGRSLLPRTLKDVKAAFNGEGKGAGLEETRLVVVLPRGEFGPPGEDSSVGAARPRSRLSLFPSLLLFPRRLSGS